MNNGKKILLGLSLIGFAIGGFVLVKYLTRNTVRLRYTTIKLQEYDTPPVEEELTD